MRLPRLIAIRAHPLNLAVFRIAVFSAIALESTLPSNNARSFAAVPRVLRLAASACPALNALPSSHAWATSAWLLLLLSCALAAAGLYTRIAAPAATALSFYVLGIPHLHDLPNHLITHHHHLIWFAILLSVSPCADALSLDSLRSRGGKDRDPAAYGVPIAAAWILIGMIYFFPGLWKTMLEHHEWSSGEKIRMVLYTRWWLSGSPAWFGLRPDLHPAFLRFLGTAVLVFEIGFIAGLALPFLRAAAVATGLLFHATTFTMMHISFWPLVACYVVFIDWSSVAGFPSPAPAWSLRGARLPALTAAALIAAVAYCGARRIDAWPFAIYPSFLTPYEPVAHSLRFTARDAKGAPMSAGPALHAAVRDYGRVRWARVTEYISMRAPQPEAQALAKALWTVLVREDSSLTAATEIDVEKTTEDLRPGHGEVTVGDVIYRGKPG